MGRVRYDAGGAAAKHKIPLSSAEHALRNNTQYIRHFDEPRIPGAPRPDLCIGPAPDGEELEIMGNWLANGDLELFHVMPVRPKTLRRIKEWEDAQRH